MGGTTSRIGRISWWVWIAVAVVIAVLVALGSTNPANSPAAPTSTTQPAQVLRFNIESDGDFGPVTNLNVYLKGGSTSSDLLDRVGDAVLTIGRNVEGNRPPMRDGLTAINIAFLHEAAPDTDPVRFANLSYKPARLREGIQHGLSAAEILGEADNGGFADPVYDRLANEWCGPVEKQRTTFCDRHEAGDL